MVATMVRTIFAQPDPESVWAQHRRVVDHLTELGLDTAAEHLDAAAAEILTFTGFPKAHWTHACSIASAVLAIGEDAGVPGMTPLASAFVA
jgi:transposase-like protein